MSQTLTPKRELTLLLTLAGIQFTNILDFMIMMPLGPQFTLLFGISDAQFGFLVSAYMLAGAVGGLAAAAWVDRLGRKRALLLCYGMAGLASLGCALAPGYAVLLAARLMAGAFGGVIAALCNTIVSEVIPFERRGRAMAVVMSSFALATVLGVPLGLFLAELWGWHAPFYAVAGLCAVLWAFAALSMPELHGHMNWAERPSVWRGIGQVLADANHLKALAFSSLLMAAGFAVIPYIALYVRSNTQIRSDQLPTMYIFGGLLSIATARLIGSMADRHGKVRVFRLMSGLGLLPMAAITLLHGTPAWLVILVSGLMFMCMSGRAIPGMALLTAAAHPNWRGTFMTLNSSVQSCSMGLAALLTGQLISRDAQGQIQGFWMAALAGGAASLAAMALAGHLVLHGAGSAAAGAAPKS